MVSILRHWYITLSLSQLFPFSVSKSFSFKEIGFVFSFLLEHIYRYHNHLSSSSSPVFSSFFFSSFGVIFSIFSSSSFILLLSLSFSFVLYSCLLFSPSFLIQCDFSSSIFFLILLRFSRFSRIWASEHSSLLFGKSKIKNSQLKQG